MEHQENIKSTKHKATSPKIKKRKRGRPTSYDPKYCKELVAYFSREPYREKEITHTNSKGEDWTEYKEVANDPPFFSAFARKIKVDTDTIVEWSHKYADFSVAYKRAKELQQEFIVTNGLKNLYAQPFAIFTMKNVCGWRDKNEFDFGDKATGAIRSIAELFATRAESEAKRLAAGEDPALVYFGRVRGANGSIASNPN